MSKLLSHGYVEEKKKSPNDDDSSSKIRSSRTIVLMMKRVVVLKPTGRALSSRCDLGTDQHRGHRGGGRPGVARGSPVVPGSQCWVAPCDLTDPQHAGPAPSAKSSLFYIYDSVH